jgi:putative FmdB family regulatory protein
MPVYDYRCNQCKRRVALFYKTYKDYDQAIHTCPNCGSTNLTRLIGRVAVAHPSRNYAGMSSDEMLNVLEGGNGREVGEMMHQLGQDEAVNDPMFREASERLMRGEDPESVGADMEAAGGFDDAGGGFGELD